MNNIPYNKEVAKLDDEDLLLEFQLPKKFKRIHLFAVLAERAKSNTKIKDLLFEYILDKNNRSNTFFGFIKMAWLPILSILEYSNDDLKQEVSELVNLWSLREREDFIIYINKLEDVKYFINKDDLEDLMRKVTRPPKREKKGKS